MLAFFDSHHQSVFTDGKTDAGSRHFRPEIFGQPVVTAAAENRVLRTQRAVRDFKCGAGVVIKPADQSRAHRVRNVRGHPETRARAGSARDLRCLRNPEWTASLSMMG